ncbi:hypothetical protein GCM10011415_27320 [Salipiger pallidus]|uniref:Uncharacterized protein n=1 Tax=Salipiger pallidus TaxID=1775170 RepID=A0A8J3EGK2_9RHOB|nr:hypothetical protein [Salipiger pallidus]GGG77013.1 hypothetical protein GCM10011415_27320 [Salipiger pallidus]
MSRTTHPLRIATLLADLIAPAHASVPAGTSTERMRLFATCAGRVAARIEHDWLLARGSDPVRTRLRRDLDALIEALLPITLAQGLDGARALHLRLSAKVAQAVLLQQADLGPDNTHAERARRLAHGQLSTCQALLPG